MSRILSRRRSRRLSGRPSRRPSGRPPNGWRSAAGQATAEYALVLLAAAALAGLLVAWATSTDAVDRLMEKVLDSLIAEASR